jgi:hypothetical protein
MKLRPEETEVARAEAQAVYALASDPDYRDELAALLAELDDEVEDVAALESIVELGLQTGRIRALYGPGGEQAALRLYRRLPNGSDARASADAVSEALSSLRGRALESIRVDAVGPGAFALTVAVDGAELSVRLDRAGARVSSVGA